MLTQNEIQAVLFLGMEAAKQYNDALLANDAQSLAKEVRLMEWEKGAMRVASLFSCEYYCESIRARLNDLQQSQQIFEWGEA
jgi:hypothetical protein